MTTTTIPVDSCSDCPFVSGPDHEDESWLCVEESVNALGARTLDQDPWREIPPTWCPLRKSDRLVTLRTK